MISLLKIIVVLVDFMLASLICLLSAESRSKSEFVGWMALAVVFVLNMILLFSLMLGCGEVVNAVDFDSIIRGFKTLQPSLLGIWSPHCSGWWIIPVTDC